MAPAGEVDADLVRPAGAETAFDQSGVIVERAFDAVASDRRSAFSFPDDSHLFAVDGAAADVAGNLARGRGGHSPHKGGVGAIDPARGEITRQGLVRGLGLGNDHQAAGIFVETVDNARPADPADAGEAPAAMSEQSFDEGAVEVSGGGVHNHAGRLVDDDQMGILETDIEIDLLRGRRPIFNLRENYDEILSVFDA